MWLLVACGGSTASPLPLMDAGVSDVTAAPRTLSAACNDIAAITCRDFDSCPYPRWRSLTFADATDCLTRARAQCLRDATAPGVVDPIDRLDRCTRASMVVRCEDRWRLLDECGLRPGQTVGSLPNGASCWQHAQCASGACRGASVRVTRFCGACAPPPREGDACDHDGRCSLGSWLPDTGLYCDGTKFVRRPREGEACTLAAACESPMTCAEGRCRTERVSPTVVLGNAGDPCDRAGDAEHPRRCRGGLFCNTARVCTPTIGLGEKCGVESVEALVCGWDAVCAVGADTMRCQAIEDLCR